MGPDWIMRLIIPLSHTQRGIYLPIYTRVGIYLPIYTQGG